MVPNKAHSASVAARHGGMPAGAGDGNLHGQEKRRATGKRCGDTAVPTVAGPH